MRCSVAVAGAVDVAAAATAAADDDDDDALVTSAHCRPITEGSVEAWRIPLEERVTQSGDNEWTHSLTHSSVEADTMMLPMLRSEKHFD